MSIYKCPYCGFETDHPLVYMIHLDKHSIYGKNDGQHKDKGVEFSFSLNK